VGAPRVVRLAGAGALGALLAAPPWLIEDYWLYVLIIGFYYAILSSSWALLVGFAGLISFAQAAFSGIGAYTSALCVLHLGVPPLLGLGFGGAVAGLVGLGIGVLTIRMRGSYLALTTIAFSEILRIVLTAEYDLTRGSYGLQVPPLLAGASRATYYYVILGLFLATFQVMRLTVRSRVGLFLKAIREDEEGATGRGVNVVGCRVLAFAMASTFAGVAGAFYGHFVRLVSPQMLILPEMSTIMAMGILGGMESLIGAAVGAIVLQVLSEYLREYVEWRLALMGALVLVMILVAPNGFAGLRRPVTRYLRSKARWTSSLKGTEGAA
jgi:branched-chain amino acid transport system permease protein